MAAITCWACRKLKTSNTLPQIWVRGDDAEDFCNLPVTDLPHSVALHKALGCAKDLQFSNEIAAYMLLTHPVFEDFAPCPTADSTATTSAIFAISRENSKAVDAMMVAVVTSGGHDNDEAQDMEGFMYSRSFCDPDGHIFEPMWMNPDAVT